MLNGLLPRVIFLHGPLFVVSYLLVPNFGNTFYDPPARTSIFLPPYEQAAERISFHVSYDAVFASSDWVSADGAMLWVLSVSFLSSSVGGTSSLPSSSFLSPSSSLFSPPSSLPSISLRILSLSSEKKRLYADNGRRGMSAGFFLCDRRFFEGGGIPDPHHNAPAPPLRHERFVYCTMACGCVIIPYEGYLS